MKSFYSLHFFVLLNNVIQGRIHGFAIFGAKKSKPTSAFTKDVNTCNAENEVRLRMSSSVASEEINTNIRKVKDLCPPSWDDLTSHVDEMKENDESAVNENLTPLVTLYRDTNGWCPFCERVWFALKIKNIPYRETLISLYDKPKWFTDIVPTGLVPVVLIHSDTIQKSREEDGKDERKANPARTLIWESLDILKALDENFPDTPKLIYEDDENYMKGREVMNKLTSTGFAFIYNSRNETLTMGEKKMQKLQFEENLDALEKFLGLHNGSPFFLNEISGLDVEAVPTLERWRYQVHLTKNMDMMEGRPNLQKWFEAMDKYEAYIERVSGDEYSWAAVASTFLKVFGTGKDGPSEETKDAIDKAEMEAEKLRSKFEQHPSDSGLFSEDLLKKGRLEAAMKLINNHEAIVKDCTNADPKSQQDLGRAADSKNADWMLRIITAVLLNIDMNSSDDDTCADINFGDASVAAKTVASRLCVPRDMGAPAAAVLRYELSSVASELRN